MSELRKAAQMALEALDQVTRHFTRIPSTLADSEKRGLAHQATDALRAALAQPERTGIYSDVVSDGGLDPRNAAQPKQEPYPLPDSLYPDSKDWVASDYAGRVEWLHFMYESKKREVEQLEAEQLERKPLTEEEINKLWTQKLDDFCWIRLFARAIEKEHGIGGKNEYF
jgi:hypothetical protein